MIDVSFPSKVQMSAEDYHRHPAIGSSSLKKVLRSVAHYEHEKSHPKSASPAMRFGTAVHTAVLEPKLFNESVVTMPEFSGTGSRAAKDQWMIQNHGKLIISDEDMIDINGIRNSISKHKMASKLLADGAAEDSYFWQDAHTGINCKCRPDFLRSRNIMADLKTTENASLEDFSRTVLKFHYHVSAAMYLEGVSNVLGQSHKTFILIAVEKSAPYGVQVFDIDTATLEKGAELYQRALQKLKNARDAGLTPCYSDDIVPLSIPNWGWYE